MAGFCWIRNCPCGLCVQTRLRALSEHSERGIEKLRPSVGGLYYDFLLYVVFVFFLYTKTEKSKTKGLSFFSKETEGLRKGTLFCKNFSTPRFFAEAVLGVHWGPTFFLRIFFPTCQ